MGGAKALLVLVRQRKLLNAEGIFIQRGIILRHKGR
jgi:hypothetical protein